MNPENKFFRYLTRHQGTEYSGVHGLDAGCTHVLPGSSYPGPGHPAGHDFSWDTGRCLGAYTFVYITAGNGVFDSEASGEVAVGPGCLFILFPGVWHRYRPLPESGWDEYWVECDGSAIRSAVESVGLTSSRPVMNVGHDDAFLRCFLNIFETIKAEPPCFEAIIGLRSLEIVARIQSLLMMAASLGVSVNERIVRKAVVRMRENLGGAINLEELARSFGASYSSFRRLFRQQTGRSPGNYFIEMKVDRARQLLDSTDKTIQEISDLLGFESVYYFSRLFKARNGVPPSSYRKNLRCGAVYEVVSKTSTGCQSGQIGQQKDHRGHGGNQA